MRDQYKSRDQLYREVLTLRKQLREYKDKYDNTQANINNVQTSPQEHNILLDYLTDYIYTVRFKKTKPAETMHGPGCVSVTGYTSKEYTKDPELWFRMVYKRDREAVSKQAQMARDGKAVPPLEHRIIHKDGSIRWVRNTVVQLRDENGKFYGYNGLINDITARKKAEKTLLTSELKYRSLTNDVLESTKVGIVILDYKYNIVWVNRAYEYYTGLKRIDIIGKNAQDYLKSTVKHLFQNPENFEKMVNSSYGSIETVNFECCRVNNHGEMVRCLEYWSMPIKTGLYAGGRIEQYYDVTEHKTILDDVVESERRHKQLLHHLTDYVYSVKVEFGEPVDTFHGIGCVAVTGYTQEDFAMNPDLWIEMVYDEDRDDVREHARKALLGKSSKPLVHRITHRDGSLRWVKSTIVLQKNEKGNVISYDGLINDITELKKAEELDKMRQQQLVQADKMVTLGILVSGVAHEINNPNNFIMLNNKMINKAWESTKPILDEYYNEHGDFVLAGMPYSKAHDKIAELITGISEGGQRIKKIVESLKNFARHDTGVLDQSINLNKVVEAAILIVNNLIKKSTTDFKVKFAPKLPEFQGNFQQLEQLLINLITNSCEALSKKEKQLHITTFWNRESNQVGFSVMDNGDGITKDDMKHIIDPFFTTKREIGGTGLGLSIAYNIIKDHGGELHLDSRLGFGTTATITIPLNDKDFGAIS